MPDGGGTGGARSLYSEGQAILLTTATVVEKGKQAASEHLEASVADIEFTPRTARFTVVGTDRGVGILDLAAASSGRARARRASAATLLDAPEVAEIKSHTFPNGCHVAEVEIDPDTGIVDIPRYIVVDDVGHALNPLIVRGQVHGGVAQGIGQALLERTAYDAESGQLLSRVLHGLRPAARRGPAGHRGRPDRGALRDQPARREGRGRGRRGRLAAGGDQRAGRCAGRTTGVRHIDMPATPESGVEGDRGGPRCLNPARRGRFPAADCQC